ncbi:MAG: C45 family peptidase [Chitinophagaceae bacterium]
MFIIFCAYVWKVSEIAPPRVTDTAILSATVAHPEGSLYTIGDNWIRKNEFGNYEMYVSGKPFDRGVKVGKLSAGLIAFQEKAFTDQIKEMVPSTSYQKFLRYVIGFLNRDLASHVDSEYQDEIYGISKSASDSFNWIGSNYDRLLNYHAAHDIGHALQGMMLVGCTSFGAWADKTSNGAMILGRNFDFYVGDEFAKNKIVAFYAPDRGHKFMYVTWGGFTGVVSGMNDAGLTVTINAAKSRIPFGAATPVSLVAREILQYAGNIKEAIAIAKSKEMFVSESFLIGSAADHKAVVIEKTPDDLDIYDPNSDQILCTNHYQGPKLLHQKLNEEQMAGSASVYRYQRLQELLNRNYPLTPEKAALVLRDRRGLHDADIGNGNEKAVNQLIAHHSIIFMPDSLRVWVSTTPFQEGTYVCYDLKKIFAMHGLQKDVPVANNALDIAPDSFLQTPAYSGFLTFRNNKHALMHHQPVDTAATINGDPKFYDAYRVAGDYCQSKGWWLAAKAYYQQALTLEIPTTTERKGLEKKVQACIKKMQPKS